VFRSEFILSCSGLALGLVIGPCGGLGGLEAEVSVGHPVSLRFPPPPARSGGGRLGKPWALAYT
jgi:hypothetical protein